MSHYNVFSTLFTQTAANVPVLNLGGAGDTVVLTATGGFYAYGVNSDGIDLVAAQQNALIDGEVYSAQHIGVYSSGLGVAIHVSGRVEGGAYGIALEGNSGLVSVSGTGNVYSEAIGMLFNGDADHLANYGQIFGGTIGIEFAHHSGSMTNDGTIAAHTAAVDVQYETNFHLINHGTIGADKDAFAIVDSTGAVIDNSGTIHGTLVVDDAESMTVHNDGVWDSGELAFAGGNDVLNNTGHITGAIFMGTGQDTLDNTGAITGNAVFSGSGDHFINDGIVQGDVAMGTGDTLENTGSIHGDVTFGTGTNRLDSSGGTITGIVTTTTGKDTLLGGVGDDTFLSGGGKDALSGGGGDDILNAGAGNDQITGGNGDDILTGGKGADAFHFAGAFGEDTITDFTAGAAAGHDKLHFAVNDFTSFSEVKAHMTHSGHNTIITLDSGDSIVLMHVDIGTLTRADFAFG
jgi:Ca2+-binding RTX toxin-like protein